MSQADSSLEAKVSLKQVPQLEQKRLFILCELLVCMVALLIPACGGFYRYLYYQQFQQGTCTITGGDVTSQYFSTKNGGSTDYYANLSYIVAVPGTNGVATQGYDGPDRTSFSQEGEAQSIVDYYSVGTVTICWYNRDHPTDAVLIFAGYSLERAWTVFWAAILAGGICTSLPILIWYQRVHLILILRKRGWVTKGVVTRSAHYRTRYGLRTLSLISYTAISVDKQQVKGTLSGQGHLRKKEHVFVCYDPFQPTKALRGQRPTRTLLIWWIIVTLLLLVLIASGASCLTYSVA